MPPSLLYKMYFIYLFCSVPENFVRVGVFVWILFLVIPPGFGRKGIGKYFLIEWMNKHRRNVGLIMKKLFTASQFSSVTQSCLTPCNCMECSMPGFPVHHQLPELAHTYWVSDVIQPSHPLSLPSLPALNLSQHQGLFKWVSSSHQVAKYWSFSFNIRVSRKIRQGRVQVVKNTLEVFSLQKMDQAQYMIQAFMCSVY